MPTPKHKRKRAKKRIKAAIGSETACCSAEDQYFEAKDGGGLIRRTSIPKIRRDSGLLCSAGGRSNLTNTGQNCGTCKDQQCRGNDTKTARLLAAKINRLQPDITTLSGVHASCTLRKGTVSIVNATLLQPTTSTKNAVLGSICQLDGSCASFSDNASEVASDGCSGISSFVPTRCSTPPTEMCESVCGSGDGAQTAHHLHGLGQLMSLPLTNNETDSFDIASSYHEPVKIMDPDEDPTVTLAESGWDVIHKQEAYPSSNPSVDSISLATETQSEATCCSLQDDMGPQSSLEAQLEAASIPFSLDGVQYVAIAPVARRPLACNTRSHLLTVVPGTEDSSWRLHEIRHILRGPETSEASSGLQDDVSGPEFRKFFLFCRLAGCETQLEDALVQYLKDYDIEYAVDQPQLMNANGKLSVGPYLWRQNKLHQVCRLYDDTNSACLQSVLPLSSPHADFEPLRLTGMGLRTISVAVSTRQRLKTPPIKPSAIFGKRVLVKDIYAMRGMTMSACNRAYHEVQTPAKKSAPLVQRLIDRGAHIIGTGKLSSMISREEPGESLDFQVPFNPRGDGYQSPAGSSSGEAAAIAAYDWLDIAIGSDSTGSGRRPAFFNGCFSLRLSSSPRYCADMMPCFPMFDAPSMFCRSILGLSDFVSEWCELQTSKTVSKASLLKCALLASAHCVQPTIIHLDGYATDTTEQRLLSDAFARDLGTCFDAEVKRINLRTSWRQKPPLEAQGQELHVYMKNVARTTFFYDFHQCTENFRKEYENRFGYAPPVNGVTRFRWQTAEQLSKEVREQAGHKLDVYRKWLKKLLFGKAQCPIVISPIATAASNDRDCKPSETFVQDAWDPLLLAPILKAPELTVPIGEVKDYSMITQRDQYLPVAISLLGKPGSDLEIIDIAQKVLEHSKRPLTVRTGERMFESGDAPNNMPGCRSCP